MSKFGTGYDTLGFDISCAARAAQVNSVVEPQLRESFEIGHPTPAYGALLQAVPLEFVGAPGRLRALVELLSAGVAATFAAQARRAWGPGSLHARITDECVLCRRGVSSWLLRLVVIPKPERSCGAEGANSRHLWQTAVC